MVHRSLVGSMERLFGHLIEVHGGAFPVWFAPVQLEVLPVGADQAAAAAACAASLVGAGLRAEVRPRRLDGGADPGRRRAEGSLCRGDRRPGGAGRPGRAAAARRRGSSRRCRRRRRSG